MAFLDVWYGVVELPIADHPLLLDEFEADQLRQALMWPRGQYSYTRASQLTGIPERTLHHWAQERFLVPDFDDYRPKLWSYRDLVFLGMVAWLRAMGMPPDRVIKHVRQVRDLVEKGDLPVGKLRSQGRILLVEGETADRITGEQIFAEVTEFLGEFDLVSPIGMTDWRGKVWGPNLVRPSRRDGRHVSVGDVRRTMHYGHPDPYVDAICASARAGA